MASLPKDVRTVCRLAWVLRKRAGMIRQNSGGGDSFEETILIKSAEITRNQ